MALLLGRVNARSSRLCKYVYRIKPLLSSPSLLADNADLFGHINRLEHSSTCGDPPPVRFVPSACTTTFLPPLRRPYSQALHTSAPCFSDNDGSNSHKSDSAPLEGKRYEYIRAEIVAEHKTGLITLARAKALNALSEGVMAEVVDALKAYDQHPEVGAIVVTGEGKAFAAGADIQEMKDKTFVEAYKTGMLAGWEAVGGIKKPIIAAVNGYALGGGCELAMMCDIILAGEKALFGQPEVKLGVLPGMGGTQRLIREVGKSRAMEMILTGEHFMDAEEAARRGLAARVVKGGQKALHAEALLLAGKLAALSRPAVAMAKEAVNAAYDVGLREGLRRERALFHASFGLKDQKEGMAAFLEKRAPAFEHQ
eukprot:jgi/Mesen1/1813/ME000140S00758